MPSTHVACNCWICKLGGYFMYEGNRKITKFPCPAPPRKDESTYRCECGFETHNKKEIQQHMKYHREELTGGIKIIKESIF